MQSIESGIGGGINYEGDSTVTVTSCIVTGNGAYIGGGIYNQYGTVTLTDSAVTNNSTGVYHADTDVYADLRIVKTVDETTVQRALVIEIKGFAGDSPIHSLENALGQYELYRMYLQSIAPDDKLYLAISETTYTKQFLRPSFAFIVREKRLPLLIVNTEQEVIIQWIN